MITPSRWRGRHQHSHIHPEGVISARGLNHTSRIGSCNDLVIKDFQIFRDSVTSSVVEASHPMDGAEHSHLNLHIYNLWVWGFGTPPLNGQEEEDQFYRTTAFDKTATIHFNRVANTTWYDPLVFVISFGQRKPMNVPH